MKQLAPKKKPPVDAIKLRLNQSPGIEPALLPKRAQRLVNAYREECEELGRAWTCILIHDIPKSANHQYRRSKNGQIHLDASIKKFRYEAFIAARLKTFKTTGTASAVIIFESPLWVTKGNCARVMDADNRIKATFDAIKDPLKFDDSSVWECFFMKAKSKFTRTWIFLFDLGDIVDSHI